MSCEPQPDHKDEEASQTFPPLKRSPSNKGFSHLASDGVWRSFSSGGEVVDYKQLSPVEIAMMLKFFEKYSPKESFKKFQEEMHGVDGRNVTDLDQLLHPGPELRPLIKKQRSRNPDSPDCPTPTPTPIQYIAD